MTTDNAEQGSRKPRPGRARTARTAGMTVALAFVVLGLTGCTNDTFTRLGFPPPITKQGETVLTLWQGSWIAGLAVGVLVWGLILWAVIFHRKRGDKLPPQARYNMPIEIMYTAVPFVLIGIFFYYTAKDENYIDTVSAKPNVIVAFKANSSLSPFSATHPANAVPALFDLSPSVLPGRASRVLDDRRSVPLSVRPPSRSTLK